MITDLILLTLNFLEKTLFYIILILVDYFYIDPHYRGLSKLFKNNINIINKNQTFLIIGGALYPRTYKVLLKLGVPENNICIWDYSIENINKTKRFFPNIQIEHNKYSKDLLINYDNVILPLALGKNNYDSLKQEKYNLIIHHYVSVFYNNPLITYYSIYFGIKKFCFIPSSENYIINSIETSTHHHVLFNWILNNILYSFSCHNI
jgi:ABC-type glycerol-3-phosphate transport system permease component